MCNWILDVRDELEKKNENGLWFLIKMVEAAGFEHKINIFK